MKRILTLTFLLVLTASASALTARTLGDRLSLNDFKNALKKDSSDESNAELAKRVLRYGVTFQYTRKRENKLRGWGANETLINAIFQSIVDKKDEIRIYREFMAAAKSEERDTRKAALEKGKLFLSRFGDNERFAVDTERIKSEMKFLECEFDASLGC